MVRRALWACVGLGTWGDRNRVQAERCRGQPWSKELGLCNNSAQDFSFDCFLKMKQKFFLLAMSSPRVLEGGVG
jgi:hypothetical protein